MLSKRSLIVGLTGLNLLLLAGLILFSYAPPSAEAAPPGRPGDYLMSTFQVHEDYDAVAIIHAPTNAMYVFVPVASGINVKLQYVGLRNLQHDFGR